MIGVDVYIDPDHLLNTSLEYDLTHELKEIGD